MNLTILSQGEFAETFLFAHSNFRDQNHGNYLFVFIPVFDKNR